MKMRPWKKPENVRFYEVNPVFVGISNSENRNINTLGLLRLSVLLAFSKAEVFFPIAFLTELLKMFWLIIRFKFFHFLNRYRGGNRSFSPIFF